VGWGWGGEGEGKGHHAHTCLFWPNILAMGANTGALLVGGECTRTKRHQLVTKPGTLTLQNQVSVAIGAGGVVWCVLCCQTRHQP